MLWWLVIVAIPLIEVSYWIWVMHLPSLTRAFAVPRQVPASLAHVLLLVFALSQVGGFVGAAFAALPQAPAWFYMLLILFLLAEIVVVVSWVFRHAWPRITRLPRLTPHTGARRAAAVTRPLAPGKP